MFLANGEKCCREIIKRQDFYCHFFMMYCESTKIETQIQDTAQVPLEWNTN